MKSLSEYKRGTKVLIWITAILFILIIILGIWYGILNKKKEERDKQRIEKHEYIPPFNSQFTIYEGIRKGSLLRDLSSRIQASNQQNQEHQVRT